MFSVPSPKKLSLLFCCGAAFAIAAALRLFHWKLFGVFSGLMIVPYLLSLPIAARITGEFTPTTRMYRAWACLTVFCALSIFRHSTDLCSVILNWHHPSAAMDLALLPIVLSLLALLAAILLMWSSFRPLGMGTALRAPDWVLLLFVPLLLLACFAGPGSFPHARSVYRVTRYLEYLNPPHPRLLRHDGHLSLPAKPANGSRRNESLHVSAGSLSRRTLYRVLRRDLELSLSLHLAQPPVGGSLLEPSLALSLGLGLALAGHRTSSPSHAVRPRLCR